MTETRFIALLFAIVEKYKWTLPTYSIVKVYL